MSKKEPDRGGPLVNPMTFGFESQPALPVRGRGGHRARRDSKPEMRARARRNRSTAVLGPPERAFPKQCRFLRRGSGVPLHGVRPKNWGVRRSMARSTQHGGTQLCGKSHVYLHKSHKSLSRPYASSLLLLLFVFGRHRCHLAAAAQAHPAASSCAIAAECALPSLHPNFRSGDRETGPMRKRKLHALSDPNCMHSDEARILKEGPPIHQHFLLAWKSGLIG